MTTNTIDFLRESARFLAKDRPDVYTEQSALSDLTEMMEHMRETDEPTWTSFASFLFVKHVEDGDEGERVEEWILTRKISSLAIFEPENEVSVFGHTDGSGTLKVGVDLPDPLDQDLDL